MGVPGIGGTSGLSCWCAQLLARSGGPSPSATRAAGLATPYVRDGNGTIDPELLAVDASYHRLSYVVLAAADVGIHFTPAQSAAVSGPDVELENARSQFREGKISRAKFLATFKQRLAKRQAVLDALLKGDKAKVDAELRDNPYEQVSLFGDQLLVALDQLRLSAAQFDKAAGWVVSHQFDLQQENRVRQSDEKQGKAAKPLPGGDWVDAQERERVGRVMRGLSVTQRQELTKAWPVLFPGAPVPATDDATYAKVGKGSVAASVPKAGPEAAATGGRTPSQPATKPVTPGKAPGTDAAGNTLSAAQKGIDVLPLIDPPKHGQAGKWESHDSALRGTADGAEPAKLVLPVRPTESYELSFTVNRLSGNTAMCLMIPVGGYPAQVWFGDGTGKKDGDYDYIQSTGAVGGGKRHPIGVNHAHKVTVRVEMKPEKASIDIHMDSLPLVRWEDLPDRLKPKRGWQLDGGDVSPGFGIAPGNTWEIKDVRIHGLAGGEIEKVE